MLYIYIYTYQSIMNMYVLCEPSHFKGSEPKLHPGQSHQAKSSSQADPFRHSLLHPVGSTDFGIWLFSGCKISNIGDRWRRIMILFTYIYIHPYTSILPTII